MTFYGPARTTPSTRLLPGYQVASFDPHDAADIVSKIARFERLLLRSVSKRVYCHVVAPVLLRARQRGIITAAQAHVLLTQFDPTQNGVAGQL